MDSSIVVSEIQNFDYEKHLVAFSNEDLEFLTYSRLEYSAHIHLFGLYLSVLILFRSPSL